MSKSCTASGCDRPHIARGLCTLHYQRWRHSEEFSHRQKETHCLVEGCQGTRHAKGYCNSHYWRFKTYGDPLAGGTYLGEPQAWLEKHKDHVGDGCLTWPFGRMADGYAQHWEDGKPILASRMMCAMVNGPPPSDGKYDAAHECGRGADACVHPKHLRWATRSQNNWDKLGHNTDNRGEKHCGHKLTECEVKEIRQLKGYFFQREIAEFYGVCEGTVSSIHRGINWYWLED